MSETQQEWLSIEQVAAALGVEVQHVRQLLKDGGLLGQRLGGQLLIPAEFIHDGEISRYLRGVITVLRDGGYSPQESLDWLLEYDESLGASPAAAMHRSLHREVSRRAQAMAL